MYALVSSRNRVPQGDGSAARPGAMPPFRRLTREAQALAAATPRTTPGKYRASVTPRAAMKISIAAHSP